MQRVHPLGSWEFHFLFFTHSCLCKTLGLVDEIVSQISGHVQGASGWFWACWRASPMLLERTGLSLKMVQMQWFVWSCEQWFDTVGCQFIFRPNFSVLMLSLFLVTRDVSDTLIFSWSTWWSGSSTGPWQMAVNLHLPLQMSIAISKDQKDTFPWYSLSYALNCLLEQGSGRKVDEKEKNQRCIHIWYARLMHEINFRLVCKQLRN